MKTLNEASIERTGDVLTSIELELIETIYQVKCLVGSRENVHHGPHLDEIEKDLKKYLSEQHPGKIV